MEIKEYIKDLTWKFSSNIAGRSQSRRGRTKEIVPQEESSSSHVAQSLSEFSIGDSSQTSQGYYPGTYQYPYFNTHNEYTSGGDPSLHPSSTNYDPYHQQQSCGFFGYVFGQGDTQDDSQSESGNYDLARHSTML